MVKLGVAVSLAALLPTAALAMEPARPCSDPFVFRGAAVNAVILPYQSTGEETPDLGLVGERLSFLVQLESFFAMMPYGHVAAVRLVEEPGAGGCDPDLVFAQLLGETGGATETVAPGHGLVLVWGRIHREDEEIYAQTYLRFRRRGEDETIVFPLEGRRLTASLPFNSVAFAPRYLTTDDLEMIQREFERSVQVREEPSSDAPGRPLSLDPREPTPYYVLDQQEGWIHLADRSGPVGWLRASLDQDDWPLRQKLPELALIDGLVGYLRLRVGEEIGSPAPPTTAQRSLSALESFLAGVSQAGNREAALAELLAGFITYLASDEPTDGLEHAIPAFSSAASRIPYDAEARTLALGARLAAAYLSVTGEEEIDPLALSDEYLRAASLAPGDDRLLENLETIYQVFAHSGHPRGDMEALPQDEIESQLQLVRAARGSMRLDASITEMQLAGAIGGAPVRGNPDAPVTIVAYSDFQCPFCVRSYQTMEQLVEKYPEDVKFVFQHFPLTQIHPWAKPAAIASVCAANQSDEAFWTLHDAYFENQGSLNPDNVVEKSKEFLAGSGIDLARWETCASDTSSAAYQAAVAEVDSDLALGQELGVSGAPGFFVNGEFLHGAQPMSAFEPLIQAERMNDGKPPHDDG